MDLSIIVPLYNEEDSVTPLYEAIVAAVAPLGLNYEIVFVDDGSRDRTFATAEGLAGADPRLKVVKLRRNYGQTPAMVAGIDYGQGEILITMDGDLQNDPSDIPNFLAEIANGYDIVVGWRRKRQDKLVTRVIPSKIANWLISQVTGVPIKDNGCSLKAYRARVIKHIPLYSEMHRFIPAMASLSGARIKQIEVNHHARRFGESKYGLSRIYKVAIDLMTIKAILVFAERAILWFSSGACIIGLASIATFFYANSEAMGSGIVMTALGTLLAALALFLLFLGLLSQLIYRSGSLRAETFSGLTAILVGGDAGAKLEASQ